METVRSAWAIRRFCALKALGRSSCQPSARSNSASDEKITEVSDQLQLISTEYPTTFETKEGVFSVNYALSDLNSLTMSPPVLA